MIVTATTDAPAVPVLESVRKLPEALPQVKVVPALVDRKSPDINDAAVTATWGAQPWQPVVAMPLTVVVTAGVVTLDLPGLVDGCCSSTIKKAAPPTRITITIAATMLLTPGLAATGS